MSSTCSAIFGYQSETQMPLWPYCLNARLLGMRVLFEVPMAVMGRPNDAGMGCPAKSSSLGLGSNRSTWLGPPSMKSQMIDLAVGAWCGFLGASGSGILVDARSSSERSREAKAIPARPMPARVKNSRLEATAQ